MKEKKYIIFLIIFAFTSIYTMEDPRGPQKGPQKKRARVEQVEQAPEESTQEATLMVIPEQAEITPEQEELLRLFLRNEEELERSFLPATFQECPLAQMPDEILLNIIGQMIPEQKIISLHKEIEQAPLGIFMSLKLEELKKLFANLLREFTRTFIQFNKISRINRKFYEFMDHNTDFLADLLRKKFHLFFDIKYPKSFNAYLIMINWWSQALTTFPSIRKDIPKFIRQQSPPMQKIIRRLFDEIQLISLIAKDNYKSKYYIEDLFRNNNFNPDNIMVASPEVTGKNFRLLSFYLITNKQPVNAILLELLLGLYARANPNFIEGKDINSPLALAAFTKNKDLIKVLLDKGANPNSVDTTDNIPVLSMIIVRGALDNKDEDQDRNTQKKVTLLLRYGANPNSIVIPIRKTWGHDYSPLSLAIDMYGIRSQLSLSIINLLLDAGADINLVDSQGITPFDIALKENNEPVIDLLLEKGNINSPDQEGKTLLIKMVEKGDRNRVSLLLDNKADINAQDSNGFTPLMHAALNNKKDIVRLLLNKDADYTLQSNRGETAVDIARRYGNDELAAYIEREIKKKEGTYYTSLLEK